jgi:hypothetical protein
MSNIGRRVAVKTYEATSVGGWSEYLTKKQVALGLQAGTTVFWMQAQLAIEKNPDFVVITADIKNFYNEGDRDKALEEHAKGIRQGNIDMGKDFKLHYNLSAQESPIFGNNGQRLGFTSSMGGQQGCPMSSRTQCLHLRASMEEINAQVKGVGGVVSGDMDDVLLCVPTGMAVALMAKFKANLVPLHLEEVPKKGQWYIKNHELADFHENAGTFLPRTRGVAETKDKDGNPIKGYGVEVAGVPMGDRGYILAVLTQKVAIASSTQILISNLLRFADPLALFQIIRQCLAAQFAYLARHVCPSIFAEFAKTIDDHLLKLLLEALGQINGSDHEELVRERIFHRVKDGGVGIPSMQRCHKASYVAAFLQAAPILIDTTEEIDGEEVTTTGAFHEQMVDILGAGSFDGGKVDLRHFLESAPAAEDENEAQCGRCSGSWRPQSLRFRTARRRPSTRSTR